MSEKAKLEAHMRRIRASVEGWTDGERAKRCDELITRLLGSGVAIDDAVRTAVERFKDGTIGFEEFSMSLKGKI